MNPKGNILVLILVAFAIIAVLPVVLSSVFWQVKLVTQIIFIFIIYATVRGFLGSGMPTILVCTVLIYFLVFKYFEVALSLYVFQLLLGLQFISVIIWGLGTRLPQQR